MSWSGRTERTERYFVSVEAKIKTNPPLTRGKRESKSLPVLCVGAEWCTTLPCLGPVVKGGSTACLVMQRKGTLTTGPMVGSCCVRVRVAQWVGCTLFYCIAHDAGTRILGGWGFEEWTRGGGERMHERSSLVVHQSCCAVGHTFELPSAALHEELLYANKRFVQNPGTGCAAANSA
jgi:hypothetical protein